MKKKKGRCLRCGKEFICRAVGTINEKKYCSMRCRTRDNALKRYNRIKENPEYKQKKKEYFNKWLSKNREYFNDLMREPSRIRVKENYHMWDSQNLCVRCGRGRDNPKSKMCNNCHKIQIKSIHKIKKQQDKK